jgi:transcription antitermination factor NusG
MDVALPDYRLATVNRGEDHAGRTLAHRTDRQPGEVGMTTECWVAVITKPQAEVRVEFGISAARLEAYLPAERMRIKLRTGERYVITKPLIPRFLFARCDPGQLHRLLEIDGVTDVLRVNSRASRIPDGFVKEFQRKQDMGEFDRADPVLNVGEMVRLKEDGLPFAGFMGRIKNARRAKDRYEIVVDEIHKLNVGVDRLERIVA